MDIIIVAVIGGVCAGLLLIGAIFVLCYNIITELRYRKHNEQRVEKRSKVRNTAVIYKIYGRKVYLEEKAYATTGNTAVRAVSVNRIYGFIHNEQPISLTVNFDKLEEPELAYLNVGLKTWVEDFIIKSGLGVKVEGKERQIGEVIYPLYRLNLKKIRGEV